MRMHRVMRHTILSASFLLGPAAGLLPITIVLGQNAQSPVAQNPAAQNPAAMIESGQALFQRDCAFCHGRDAEGGETGPDLTRSKLVGEDAGGSE